MKKFFAIAFVFVVGAVVIILSRCMLGGDLPNGDYFAEDGTGEWMRITRKTIVIGRGKSSFSTLPNKIDEILFDKNDISKSHPQYLRYNTNTIEWVREASGPSPKYTIIFRKK